MSWNTINCPECEAKNIISKMEICTDIVNICPNCGFEYDLDDDECADAYFTKELAKIFPPSSLKGEDEEGEYRIFDYMDSIYKIKKWKEQASYYEKIKSLISDLISSIYYNCTIISDNHLQIIKDLMFSIYSEKNYDIKRRIYPSDMKK